MHLRDLPDDILRLVFKQPLEANVPGVGGFEDTNIVSNVDLVVSAGCINAVKRVNIRVYYAGSPFPGLDAVIRLMRKAAETWQVRGRYTPVLSEFITCTFLTELLNVQRLFIKKLHISAIREGQMREVPVSMIKYLLLKMPTLINQYPAHVPVRPGSYIVEFHDEAAGLHAEQVRALPGVSVDHHYQGLFRGMAVTLGDSAHPNHLAEVYGVKAVHPNRIFSLERRFGDQNTTSTFLHEMTGVQRALTELGLDGKGVSIGIIDTGVDYTHPDLGGCWKTEGCPWRSGKDLVGDDFTPGDKSAVPKPNPTPLDQCNGHGTHVAGILMARGGSVQGVAPAATYGMYRVFGCPQGGEASHGTEDVIIKAMGDAHRDGHQIISMSLGNSGWTDHPVAIYADKLVKAGVVVVAAAGNDGKSGLLTTSIPAASPSAISVGSVDNWNITVAPIVISTPQGTREVQQWRSSANATDNVFPADTDLPVVAVKDSTGNPNACNPIAQDLTGKVAIVQRGNCTFMTKLLFAQDAGAIGVININDDRLPTWVGILPPARIPSTLISTEDGAFLLRGAASGPATVRFPKYLHKVFGSATGGRMSEFSSLGPTNEFDLSPHVSAPGGNIWSTFPTTMGSYASMSGTSMATPYVSGAVALLKQARPELTVAQIRTTLMSTARPVADPVTGKAATPLWSGAGLVNVYDSVKSRALVDPPYLAINNTGVYGDNRPVPASFTRTVTITNTDKKSPARVSMASVVANSVTMINPNGTLTAAAMAGLPLDTWPADKSAVPPGTLPGVECSGCDREIAPGASATVSLTITRPTGLEESAHWFYGGFAQFSMQWEGCTQTSKYVVPYAGYNGDYTKLNVLAPAAAGLSLFLDKDGQSIKNAAEIVVTRNSTVYFTPFMNLPSRRAFATLVDANGKTAGYLPDDGCAHDLVRTYLTGATDYAVPVNGTVLATCGSAQATAVPPGKYRVRVAMLRLLGNPDRESDYETQDSALFTIA
ncbi:hypothetical protein H4R18_000578 [Coemansia javaensis]|uniref:Subtilisin-like protein n=1 Tax=Coemansia javaensis TaxID=2761396 RepID=A0A9W8HKS3_9FUNG|nr:hypothetical protein H4R18_000578 [Coemansia javaensis]